MKISYWKRAKKLVSLFTILAYFVTSHLQAAPALTGAQLSQPTAFNFADIQKWGRIAHTHLGQKPQNIILIQDAHLQEDAQRNIAAMLGVLFIKQKIDLIQVEGATGDLDTSIYEIADSKKIRTLVADYFLKNGKWAGPEYFKITERAPVQLFGVEDAGLYTRNREAYLKLADNRETYEKAVTSFSKSVLELGRYGLPSEIYQLHLLRSQSDAEAQNFWAYLKHLFEQSEKNKLLAKPEYAQLQALKVALTLLEAQKFEFKSDQLEKMIRRVSPKLSREQTTRLLMGQVQYRLGRLDKAAFYELVKNIFELVEPSANLANELKPWVAHLTLLSVFENDHGDLSQKIKALDRVLRKTVLKDAKALALDTWIEAVSVLKKLVSLEMSEDDVRFFLANRQTLAEGALITQWEIYAKRYKFEVSANDSVRVLSQAVAQAEEFYQAALARDEAMAHNAIQKMRASGKKQSVIVLGGFHTAGMQRILESQGLSYTVVTPRIEKMTDLALAERLYESAMREEVTSLEKEVTRKLDAKHFEVKDSFLQLAVLKSFPQKGPEAAALLASVQAALRSGLPASATSTLKAAVAAVLLLVTSATLEGEPVSGELAPLAKTVQVVNVSGGRAVGMPMGNQYFVVSYISSGNLKPVSGVFAGFVSHAEWRSLIQRSENREPMTAENLHMPESVASFILEGLSSYASARLPNTVTKGILNYYRSKDWNDDEIEKFALTPAHVKDVKAALTGLVQEAQRMKRAGGPSTSRSTSAPASSQSDSSSGTGRRPFVYQSALDEPSSNSNGGRASEKLGELDTPLEPFNNGSPSAVAPVAERASPAPLRGGSTGSRANQAQQYLLDQPAGRVYSIEGENYDHMAILEKSTPWLEGMPKSTVDGQSLIAIALRKKGQNGINAWILRTVYPGKLPNLSKEQVDAGAPIERETEALFARDTWRFARDSVGLGIAEKNFGQFHNASIATVARWNLDAYNRYVDKGFWHRVKIDIKNAEKLFLEELGIFGIASILTGAAGGFFAKQLGVSAALGIVLFVVGLIVPSVVIGIGFSLKTVFFRIGTKFYRNDAARYLDLVAVKVDRVSQTAEFDLDQYQFWAQIPDEEAFSSLNDAERAAFVHAKFAAEGVELTPAIIDQIKERAAFLSQEPSFSLHVVELLQRTNVALDLGKKFAGYVRDIETERAGLQQAFVEAIDRATSFDELESAYENLRLGQFKLEGRQYGFRHLILNVTSQQKRPDFGKFELLLQNTAAAIKRKKTGEVLPEDQQRALDDDFNHLLRERLTSFEANRPMGGALAVNHDGAVQEAISPEAAPLSQTSGSLAHRLDEAFEAAVAVAAHVANLTLLYQQFAQGKFAFEDAEYGMEHLVVGLEASEALDVKQAILRAKSALEYAADIPLTVDRLANPDDFSHPVNAVLKSRLDEILGFQQQAETGEGDTLDLDDQNDGVPDYLKRNKQRDSKPASRKNITTGMIIWAYVVSFWQVINPFSSWRRAGITFASLVVVGGMIAASLFIAEKDADDRAETARVAAEQKVQAEKQAAEDRANAAKIAAKREEAERIAAAERKAKAEADKQAAEDRAIAARIAAENQAKAEQAAKDRAVAEKLAAERKAEADKQAAIAAMPAAPEVTPAPAVAETPAPPTIVKVELTSEGYKKTTFSNGDIGMSPEPLKAEAIAQLKLDPKFVLTAAEQPAKPTDAVDATTQTDMPSAAVASGNETEAGQPSNQPQDLRNQEAFQAQVAEFQATVVKLNDEITSGLVSDGTLAVGPKGRPILKAYLDQVAGIWKSLNENERNQLPENIRFAFAGIANVMGEEDISRVGYLTKSRQIRHWLNHQGGEEMLAQMAGTGQASAKLAGQADPSKKPDGSTEVTPVAQDASDAKPNGIDTLPDNSVGDLLQIELDEKLAGLLGVKAIQVARPSQPLSESKTIETPQGQVNVKSEITFWLIKNSQPETGSVDPIVRLGLDGKLRDAVGFFYESIHDVRGILVSEVFGVKIDDFENSEAIVLSAWSSLHDINGSVKAEVFQPGLDDQGNPFFSYINLLPKHARMSLAVPHDLRGDTHLDQKTAAPISSLSPTSGELVWALAGQMRQVIDSRSLASNPGPDATLFGSQTPGSAPAVDQPQSELDRLIDARIAVLKSRFEMLEKHPDFENHQITEGEESFGLVSPIEVGSLSFDRVRMVGGNDVGFRIDLVSSQSGQIVPIISFKRSNLKARGLPPGFLRYMVVHSDGPFRLGNYGFGSEKAFNKAGRPAYLGDSLLGDFGLPEPLGIDDATQSFYRVAAAIVKGGRLAKPGKIGASSSAAKRSEFRGWQAAASAMDMLKIEVGAGSMSLNQFLATVAMDKNMAFFNWDEATNFDDAVDLLNQIAIQNSDKKIVVTGSITKETFARLKMRVESLKPLEHFEGALSAAMGKQGVGFSSAVALKNVASWSKASVASRQMAAAEIAKVPVLVIGGNIPQITHSMNLASFLDQLEMQFAAEQDFKEAA